jgi:hypothetical protein
MDGDIHQRHPYTSIKYRSAFKMLLETLPIIQANKVSEPELFQTRRPQPLPILLPLEREWGGRGVKNWLIRGESFEMDRKRIVVR